MARQLRRRIEQSGQVSKGDQMPEGSSTDSAEPAGGGDPSSSGRGNTRPVTRRRYPALWAAAGLVLLGGSAGIVLLHDSGGRPPTQTAFCGLVECSVLRSADSEPTGNPRPAPVPSSPLAPSRAAPVPVSARRPAPTTPAPTPVPAPVPAPATSPAPAASPEPGRTPEPVRTPPPPVLTWTPPPPRGPWPSRWPRPPWAPVGGDWFHHSSWGQGWQGQRYHQPSWW